VSKIDAAEADLAAYNSDTAGASVTYGIPISEDRSISLGLGYEKVSLEVPVTGAKVAQDFVSAYGESNGAIKATLGWAHDTLDSPIFPTRGVVHRVTAEVAVPGGDLEYYRLTYAATAYMPISKDYTFKLKGELGYGDGYGDTGALPFFKNYYAGGASSVRGYKSRTLGPRDIGGPDETLPIGGSSRVLGNAEFLFPVPGSSKDNKSMRLSVFVDGGMVYGPNENIDFGAMRYSTGLAFNWFSPLGPLSISVATPLNKKDGDQTESIQFTLGTLFR
jgi:outer membrane protein insertion porin family